MTPLLLITGFLGAGKTTLLTRLLPLLASRGLQPHILLNDFQNAAVDAARLRDLTDRVTPVNGSCICCGSRDDFLDTLAALPLAGPSLVLVEANGASDPQEILEMLAADRRACRYAPPAQAHVVDLSRWQRRHWNNPLEREQARTASHLIATREDEVSPVRRLEVEAELSQLNPRARFVDAAALLDSMTADCGRAVPGDRPRSTKEHGRNHLAAWSCALPHPVTRERLRDWTAHLPAYVIRAKGVAFIDDGRAVLFQRVDPASEPSLMELGTPDDLQSTVIFIGPQLDTDELARRVASLRVTTPGESTTVPSP